MVTTYSPRKPKDPPPPEIIVVIRKKDHPIGAQIKDAAKAIKKGCPDIFKQEEPYPTVRLAKFKEDKIVYEITEGTKRSRGNVGSI